MSYNWVQDENIILRPIFCNIHRESKKESVGERIMKIGQYMYLAKIWTRV